MTQKLKSTIMRKDKDFLQELIDSPNVMKRKLMSNLVLERQDQISSQLTRLRMRPLPAAAPAIAAAAVAVDAVDASEKMIDELEKDSK